MKDKKETDPDASGRPSDYSGLCLDLSDRNDPD